MPRTLTWAAIAVLLYGSAHAQNGTNPNCTTTKEGQTFDYIVIGSGAGGIPIADRLSEAGHSVLLVEKGPLSSGRWNGTMKPTWLEGTNLTRFDVPGLFNQIWADPTGVACDDTEIMAGCVLGGGVAVNSALWWKPHPRDWDLNFPAGWKNSDMANYIEKVWKRIPGTYRSSRDGKRYYPQGFDTISKGLDAAGWEYVVANDNSDKKNFTYADATFFIENGERHGPLRTYLETAAPRPKFAMWTNTNARRLIRTGGHVTGVELECTKGGSVGAGYSGTVNVTAKTGRVIVSAGTFGSPKLLFRSGIGPEDQLNIVKNSEMDGPTMIDSKEWINLPVGYNLNDHVGTDMQIAHPDVRFYDFYAAWDTPIESDKEQYLKDRSGMLAQVAPNLGPIAWQQINASDGSLRHIQWQSRVEGRTNTSMTITQYLGTGTTSRGRMGITPTMNTRVLTAPYLRDAADKDAVIKGFEYMRSTLSQVQNLTWITPTATQNITQWVNLIPATPGQRGSNHWTGSCTIGTDDGREGGKAVVDLDTKVYGTDNLFVVDASIFPGMLTGNPSGAIIAVAERAADRILALKAPASA